MTAGTPKDPLWDRNQAIFDLCACLFWEYDRAAKVFGVTPERAKQIVYRERSRRRRCAEERMIHDESSPVSKDLTPFAPG